MNGPTTALEFQRFYESLGYRPKDAEEMASARKQMIGMMSAEQWAEFHAKMNSNEGDEMPIVGIAKEKISESPVRKVSLKSLSEHAQLALAHALVDDCLRMNSDKVSAKSALASLLELESPPAEQPSSPPIDATFVSTDELVTAMKNSLPVADWTTYETLRKIPDHFWKSAAAAVVSKYFELSTVPGQPAG